MSKKYYESKIHVESYFYPKKLQVYFNDDKKIYKKKIEKDYEKMNANISMNLLNRTLFVKVQKILLI